MVYYNDNDPKACAWLAGLIKTGELPAGKVDCRSILEIKPDELEHYTQCHFFAGIGGWPLALKWAGWSDDRPVWTGSCPCQPLSCAGQHKGHADERHLWPAFYNLIAECKPATVFGEQVASKDGREWLAGVRADLEGIGYAIGAADLCAAGVAAPHRRQRLFWVAAAEGRRINRGHDGKQAVGVPQIAESNIRRTAGELADAAGGQCEQCLQPQGDGLQRPAEHSATGKLDHTPSPRCNGPERDAETDTRNQTRMRLPDAGGETLQLGHAAGRGCGECGNAPQPGHSGHAERPGWSRFETVHCRDGKTRRFEPESFPLANGIPGRVGLLRGYGNAIVPQVAQAFIEAFLERHP